MAFPILVSIHSLLPSQYALGMMPVWCETDWEQVDFAFCSLPVQQTRDCWGCQFQNHRRSVRKLARMR